MQFFYFHLDTDNDVLKSEDVQILCKIIIRLPSWDGAARGSEHWAKLLVGDAIPRQGIVRSVFEESVWVWKD